MWEALGTHRYRIIAALALVFLLAHFGSALWIDRDGRWLRGDARGYFAYLPSILIDHDLLFANDFARLNGEPPSDPEGPELDAPDRGWAFNALPIGPALLWAPFYLVGLLAQAVLAVALGWGQPWDGHGFLPTAAVIVAGIAYAGAAAALTARILERWFSPSLATASALTVWLASPALYYTAVSPVYSHTTAWFVVALAICLWLRARDRRDDSDGWRAWLLAGSAFGLAAAVRQQDALLLAALAIDLLWGGGHRIFSPARVRSGLALGLGVAAGFAPQIIAWKVLFGWYLGSPIGWDLFRWTEPRFLEPLLSLGYNGLFSWTPVTALGLVGLVLLVRRDPRVVGGLLLALIAMLYYEFSIYDQHAGSTWGARRFISVNVAFAAGVGALWLPVAARFPVLPGAVASVLVAWNVVLLGAYEWLVHRHGIHAPLRTVVGWLFTGQLDR